MQQKKESSRESREMVQLFSGGHTNRLLLSLCSGLPQEVDYALQLLVQASYASPASVPLETLPGLPAALLDIVCCELGHVDSESTRRRLEAALSLRNLVLEGGPRCIDQIRLVQGALFETLNAVASMPDPSAELLLYLLDTAEVYAATTELCHNSEDDGAVSPKNQPAPLQLYESLAQLAQSSDRALVIGAYTLLGALAMCEQNEKVFTRSLHSTEEDATHTLLKRVLLLVAANDASLILPVLEFLYQHTSIPTNAALMLREPRLRDTLRLLVHRVPEGSREEVLEMEVNGVDARRGARIRDNLRATYPVLTVEEQDAHGGFNAIPSLGPSQLQQIVQLPEPARTFDWLRRVYEPYPDSEIVQVALWQAYQKQFEPYHLQMRDNNVPSMQPATEVIKCAGQAFPQAQPLVRTNPDGTKVYVMRGLRAKPETLPRDMARERLNARWKCRWQSCPIQPNFNRPEELYSHLCAVHVDQRFLAQSAPCQMRGCNYVAHSPANMRLHLRVHILPSAPANREKQVASVHAADARDRAVSTYKHRRIIPQQVNGAAAGVGFVACLVLRNISRAIAGAAAQYRQAKASDPTAKSIVYTPAIASLDGEPDNQGPSIELSEEEVVAAINSLAAVEQQAVQLAASNSALADYLTELLQNTIQAKAALK